MAEHTGFWRDTWRGLHRRPKFVVAAALILFDPCRGDVSGVVHRQSIPPMPIPSQSLLRPSAAHWFGTDLQGHDIYARTVYGARASVMVGLGATLAGVRRRRGAGRAGRLLRGLGRRRGLAHHRRVLRIAAAVGRHRAHAGHAPPHGVDGDRDPGPVRLAAGGPDRPWRGARGAGQRLRAGSEGIGAEQVSDPAAACAAQRPGSGDRGGHDCPWAVHRHRGHVVLPRRRTADVGGVLGWRYQHRRRPGCGRARPYCSILLAHWRLRCWPS